MSEDTAIAGFIGAVIGAGASVAGMFIQQWFQNRRDRIKIAADLAISDFKCRLELGRTGEGPSNIPPVSAFLIYHSKLLDILNRGDINEKKLQELSAEYTKILGAFPGAPKQNAK